MRSIEDFAGVWYIRWVAGQGPLGVQPGWQVVIGKGDGGGPGGESGVGFAVFQPGENGWHPVHSSDESHPLVLVDGQLRWDGTNADGSPVRFYISIAEARSRDEGTTFSLYGTTLLGDPDQVAVWGANDGPPPDPDA